MIIRAGTGGAQKRKSNVGASVQAASTSSASLGTSPNRQSFETLQEVG